MLWIVVVSCVRAKKMAFQEGGKGGKGQGQHQVDGRNHKPDLKTKKGLSDDGSPFHGNIIHSNSGYQGRVFYQRDRL